MRIFKQTIKYPLVIRYLKEWRRHLKGQVILVWDGLPAHQAKATALFLKSQKNWLQVERFPAYAPELNPPEYLWSALKGKDFANLYIAAIDDLDACIRKGKRRIRRRPDLLSSFLKESGLFNKELST